MAWLKTRFICAARFGILALGVLTAITAPNAAEETIVYGGNILGRRDMIEVDLTTNSSRRVDATLFDTQAMAQDPATGLVYYFEASTYFSSGNELAYWDPETYTNTRVRTYNPAPWTAAKRAAFNPNGDLYMMDSGGELFIVDKATGDLAYRGQVEGIPTALSASGDMAFSPDGVLYVVVSDNLYRVDLTSSETFEAILLDSNMRSSSYVWTGLAYCNGSLYATDLNPYGFSPDSSVFRIDLDGDDVTGVTELFSHNDMINDLTSCPATGSGNLPPELVLDPMGDQVIDIGESLEITVMATDPDGDDLEYEAAELPEGATFIDQIFYWAPSGGQEGLYEVTFTVTDSGSPPKKDSETITIMVGNLPPELNPIGNRSVDVGDLLEFTITATDPNVEDIDNLVFTMDLPPPAVLNQATGEFSWTPGEAGDYTVTFFVTDPGGEWDSETIVISVDQPKSRCGAAPMNRDGGHTRLSAVHTAGQALLPLLPSLIALGVWGIYRTAGRRRKR